MRLAELVTPTIDKNRIKSESDKVWSHFGVEIGFTDHFLNQVELARNNPSITTEEIISLFGFAMLSTWKRDHRSQG